MANTVQTFSSQPTTLQTTLLFPPNTVLTVKMNPSNSNINNPTTTFYNLFSGILIGEEEETKVGEQLNESH